MSPGIEIIQYHAGTGTQYDKLYLRKKPAHRQNFNINRSLVGNNVADHSDVAGASPVVDAPKTSSLST